MLRVCYAESKDPLGQRFLAHLWGAYAIPVALSGVRRLSYVVCRLCPP